MSKFIYKHIDNNPFIPKVHGNEPEDQLIYYVNRAYDASSLIPYQRNMMLYDAIKFVKFGKFAKHHVYLNKNLMERLFLVAKNAVVTSTEIIITTKQLGMLCHTIDEMLDIMAESYKQHITADTTSVGSPS